MFEILTHSHDKLNNVGGNNQQSIKTRAKPPRPPQIRVILSDWLYYCGVCFTKRHLRKVFKFVLNQGLFIFKAIDG